MFSRPPWLNQHERSEELESYTRSGCGKVREDSAGASLGFIEMARRVKKFEFDFVESAAVHYSCIEAG